MSAGLKLVIRLYSYSLVGGSSFLPLQFGYVFTYI